MSDTSNGLRRYMALWIFLALQTGTSIWWLATLTNEIANMHEVGGVPISTEARERIAGIEYRVGSCERRLDALERK